MTLNEVRQKYLDFFAKKGHTVIPSASLVPENDPTTLFTGSGMQPLVPYLLGQKHPAGVRLTNSQKCFRAEDMDEVGDNRHTTFFEMLGNWSLGDYWKKEQLGWFFEFLTKEIGIPKERLAVTCFEGDPKLNLPRDTESAEIWEKLGVPKERIFFYPAKKNWWSRSGAPEKMPVGEPGGPDSEVFYEFTQVEHNKKFGEKCHPNCDCGRFMEIGNSVFMEYRKVDNGPVKSPAGDHGASFEKMAQKNVDFGGGLERITAAANNESDIFRVDVFSLTIKEIEQVSTKSYEDILNKKPFRIISDHLRASVTLISDGVSPSKNDAGYFVRRLIRRSIYYGGKLGIEHDFFNQIVGKLNVDKNILSVLIDEEKASRRSIKNAVEEMKRKLNKKGYLDTNDWFDLYQTYGMQKEFMLEQVEDTNEMLREGAKHGISRLWEFDEQKFDELVRTHQEVSRAGADKKFKGGLADTSEISVKYHTATHLLHQALRDVLGNEVRQKGSNITPERLRFDFAFSRKMTDEEKKKVEEIVNEKIAAALPVQKIVLPFAEAEKTGALHFFGEKYGDQVNVYFIGNSLEQAYSKEFCGGPHVSNTSEIGRFKITKEEAVSAGVRRIKAVLE